MKNYSSLIAFLGILTLIIFPLYEVNNTEQDYLDIVSKSFQAIEAEFYELNIEAWAQIKKKGISPEELEHIYNNIAEKLSISPNEKKFEMYEDFTSIYCQELLEDDVYIQLSLQSSFIESGSGTFLGILVSIDDQQNSRKYFNIVKEIFEGFKSQQDVGITLVGTLPGELAKEEQLRQTSLAFNAVNAQVLEGIKTEELLSYSGYTPQCTDYLIVENKKINLNVALRYHSLDNKTYIHVGAPLIFQEY